MAKGTNLSNMSPEEKKAHKAKQQREYYARKNKSHFLNGKRQIAHPATKWAEDDYERHEWKTEWF